MNARLLCLPECSLCMLRSNNAACMKNRLRNHNQKGTARTSHVRGICLDEELAQQGQRADRQAAIADEGNKRTRA